MYLMLVAACTISLCSMALGQPDSVWSRYCGDTFRELQVTCRTSDGGIVMGGEGIVYAPIYLLKVDEQGEVLWDRTYDFTLSERSRTWSVSGTLAGDLLVTGSMFHSEGSGGAVSGIKFLVNGWGSPMWYRGASFTYKGFETEDGSHTWLTTHGFLNTSVLGDTNWSVEMEDVLSSTSIQTSDWGFLVFNDDTLKKFDAFGQPVWFVQIPTSGRALVETSDGGCALAGISEGNFSLTKLSDLHAIEWSRTYGGVGNDYCYSAIQLPDAGFLLAGDTDSYGNGGRDIWLLRVSADGDSLWSRTFGTDSYETCRGVFLAQDNGYFIAGQRHGDENAIFWLIRTEPDPTLDVTAPGHSGIPAHFTLSAYPNPFNPVTTLTLSLAGVQDVEVALYDISGRLVEELSQGRMAAGDHAYRIDAAGLPSGIYFARADAGAQTNTVKLVLMK